MASTDGTGEDAVCFGLVNVNSLVNKVNYVSSMLVDSDISILGICETWLVDSVPSSFVDIPGYLFYRQDVRGTVRKHGVGLYVRVGLSAVVVASEVPNVLIVQVPIWELYVVVIYRPPSNDPTADELVCRFISDFALNKNIVILGDFNLPNLKWTDSWERTGSYITPIEHLYFGSFLEAGLVQLVQEPTFVTSGNTLDLILVSNPEIVGDVTVISPLPRCHHCPVLATLLLPLEPNSAGVKYTRLWHKGNYSAISEELMSVCWDSLFEGESVDSSYEIFLNMYQELVERYVPLKECNTGTGFRLRPPRSLLRRRQILWQEFCSIRNDMGRSHALTTRAWEAYSVVNQDYRNYTVNRQKEHELELVRKIGEMPKLFHSYLRRKKKGNPPIGPLKQGDSLISNAVEMSDVFLDCFIGVFNPRVPSNASPHQHCNVSMDNLSISLGDVLAALSKLNVSRAPGPDDVHPHLLKSCSGAVAFPLFLIFVKSLRSCELPAAWKCSIVVPLFKSGSRCSPANYRPVSLTSVACKTMERILAVHIEQFLEANGLLSERQFGFRKGRSTEDQMLLVYGEVARLVDAGRVVDMVYLDFSKAFDLVSHQILIEKLIALGFHRDVVGWIRSFLLGRSMSVLVSGGMSRSETVTSGVPQGSVLGPLLFLIYVNCITSSVVGSWAAFADDFKISMCLPLAPSNGINQLQRDLDAIAEKSLSWNLKLNPSKCAVIRFGGGSRSMRPPDPDYRICGVTVRHLTKFMDLGIIVDESLKFHHHIDLVVGRTSSMITNLLRSTVCRDAEFMMTLWVSHVRPLIEYGCCVWNVGYLMDVRRLESLQRRWTREVAGLDGLVYSARLHRLDLFSIRGRLMRIDLIKIWKCFQSEVDVGLCSLFEMARGERTRGHRFKLAVPRLWSELGRRTFGVRSVRIWNSLPSSLVEVTNVDAFKRGLDVSLGEELYRSA